MLQKQGFVIQVGPEFKYELKRLGATTKNIERVVREELQTTAIFMRGVITSSFQTTPKMTRIKSKSTSNAQNPSGNFNWTIGGKMHIPSSPGYAPAVASTSLLKSIVMDVRQNEIEVGSNLKGKKGKYPRYLEFGTKNMDARPFMQPAFMRGKRMFYSTIRTVILRSIK